MDTASSSLGSLGAKESVKNVNNILASLFPGTSAKPAYSLALQQQEPVLGAAGQDNGLPSSPSSWRPTLSPTPKGKPSTDFCGGDYRIVSLSRYGAPQGMLGTKSKRNLWACSLPSSNPNPEHQRGEDRYFLTFPEVSSELAAKL